MLNFAVYFVCNEVNFEDVNDNQLVSVVVSK